MLVKFVRIVPILYNRVMPTVFSLPCQLDESISNFRVVGWYYSFLLKLKETPVSIQWRT